MAPFAASIGSNFPMEIFPLLEGLLSKVVKPVPVKEWYWHISSCLELQGLATNLVPIVSVC